MDMVSDSGAITDVNEIAAALGLTPEEIHKEDEVVMATSLEDLLESISQVEASVDNEDIDIDVLTPAMESVLNVAKGIQASGAISRSDALTLRQMTASLEGFQDTFSNMPINSFTETPSKVNFDASMEGIFGDIGRKIVEIIKAIVKWIKEKSKAFVNIFRDNRVKTKQTEEAAKKVDEALAASEKAMASINISDIMTAAAMQNMADTHEAIKSSKPEWDALRAKLGEKNTSGWAKGASARDSGKQVQLDVPMLVTSLAYESRSSNAKKFASVFQDITTHVSGKAWIANMDIINPSVPDRIVELDKCLFEESKLEKVEATVTSCAKALRSIAARLAEEASDVDVLTVSNPEAVVRGILTNMLHSKMFALSNTTMPMLIKSTNFGTQRVSTLESEVVKAVQRGEQLVDKDPRVEEVRRLKVIVKANEDLDYIYRSVMSAYAKITKIGGDLAKNPATAKAA